MIEHPPARRPRLSVGLAVALFVTALLSVGLVAPAGASPSWSLVSTPNQGSANNFLYGASCVSAKSCTAVGFSGGGGAPLIESTSGAGWKVVPSPTLGGAFDMLRGVSCVSTKWCVAVGWGEIPGTSGFHRTLIDSWNGKKWALVPSPNRGKSNNDLDAVSCVSAQSCLAVGSWQASASGDHLTLIESWNGAAWTADTTSPTVPPKIGTKEAVEDALNGVSCVTATSCTAVGSYQDTRGFNRTMILSLKGTAWSVVKSPNNGLTGNTLAGVSCASVKACEAVGTYGGGSFGDPGTPRTLTESWNGTTWARIFSPNPGNSLDALAGVSCAAAKSCQAVGYWQKSGGGPYHTLVESWNGSSWKTVSSPNPVAGSKPETYLVVTGSGLNGVSCVSTTSCRAAGFHDNSSGKDRTLVEAYG